MKKKTAIILAAFAVCWIPVGVVLALTRKKSK